MKESLHSIVQLTSTVVGHYADPVVSVGHQTDNQSRVFSAAAQIENRGVFVVFAAPVFDAVADQITAHLLSRKVHRQPRHVQSRRVESTS